MVSLLVWQFITITFLSHSGVEIHHGGIQYRSILSDFVSSHVHFRVLMYDMQHSCSGAIYACSRCMLHWLCVSTICVQAIGAAIFTYKWPNPSPAYFGYHEVFHIFTIIGAMCIFLCNVSVIHRTCNPDLLPHTTATTTTSLFITRSWVSNISTVYIIYNLQSKILYYIHTYIIHFIQNFKKLFELLTIRTFIKLVTLYSYVD